MMVLSVRVELDVSRSELANTATWVMVTCLMAAKRLKLKRQGPNRARQSELVPWLVPLCCSGIRNLWAGTDSAQQLNENIYITRHL